MTVATTIDASGPYYPNGATVAFPFLFDAGSIDDVEVVIVAADGSETTVSSALYTVTLAGGDAAGGTVTYAAAPAALAVGSALWVVLSPSFEQMIGFVDEGAFNQSMLNPMADEGARRAVWLRSRIERAITLPRGEAGFAIPGPAARANKAMVFDDDGNLDFPGSSVFKGDPGGNVMSVGLWSQIGTIAISVGTDLIATSGYDVVGTGAGIYVSDAIATAGLAAAHPHLCRQTSNGRYFRLLPGAAGIFVEQAGAVGSDAVNHAVDNRAAVQAAVEYAQAIDALTITFRYPHYTVWTPPRTYATNDYDLDQTGIPLVIDGKHLTFKSMCGRTDIWRRAPNGGDPADWVNWPLLSGGDYWRGGFFYLKGPLGAPPALFSDRSGLTLEDIHLQGGILRGASYGAMNLGTGDGWDLTDKAINAGGGDAYVGDIRLIRSSLIGYRGEVLYGSGKTDCMIYVRDSYIAESNGSGINPNSCKLDVEGLLIRRCNLGVEGWGGDIGKFHAVIEDCIQAGTLGGGKAGVGVFSPYNSPTRINTFIPSLDLDLEIRKSGNFNLGSFTHGRGVTVIDCRVVFNGSAYADGIWDTHISEIKVITDETTSAGVDFTGGDGTVSALQGIQDVKIDRISYSRTKAARAAGRLPGTPFTWTKSLGQGIVIGEADGELGAPPVYTGTPADYAPAFLKTNFTNMPGFGAALQNIQTTPALSWRGPYVGISTTGTGVYNMTLPTANRNKGERITLHGLGPGTARINGDPTSGSGLRSNSQSLFILPNLRTTLEWDGAYWFPVDGAITEMTFSQAAYDAPNLVTLTRGTLTFTVPGVALGDKIKSISFGIDTGGVEVGLPYVSAADTVSVKVYNPTGADIDWAATTVRINWTKAT